jgi:hypothetical protein
MSVDVGDAVFKFLGDSTNLDAKFDAIPGDAEKAFNAAGDSAEDFGDRTRTAMRDARGEVRLLGEEIGVRLPRHVANFLAEMPAFQKVFSAAFSATALLFLGQAFVEVGKKVSDFIANEFVLTKALKDSEAATAATNQELLKLREGYDQAKEALEKFGAAGSDAMRLKLADLKEQIENTKQSLTQGEQQNQQQRSITHEYISQNGWLSKSYDWVKSLVTGGRTQIDTIKAQTTAIQNKVLVDNATLKTLEEQQKLLEKQLDTEHKLEAIRSQGETGAASAKLKAAQQQAAVALDSQTAEKRKQIAEQLEDQLYVIRRNGMLKQLAILKEDDANTVDAQKKLLAEMKAAADDQARVVEERLTKLKDSLLKTYQDIQKTVQDAPPIEIITPRSVQNLLQGVAAAKLMGVTLRQDLVKALEDAKKAQDDFMMSGIKDGVAQTQFANKVEAARKALDDFGKSEDTLKLKTELTWQAFRSDMNKGADSPHVLSDIGAEAFNDLAKDIQNAFAQIVLGQGKVTQELEKALASQLASIAAQAAVKALFYTAEGFAALASLNAPSAANFFTAAGEMSAVAVTAGAAGRLLNGVGGSSSNTQQLHTNESNTGSSAGSTASVSGVQQFAEGGLISAPTLAVLGEESKREAVLPLTDDRAMSQIAAAIGQHGGGGMHVNIEGLISSDNLAKVMTQMNKLTMRNQARLVASDSLRVTKRSA